MSYNPNNTTNTFFNMTKLLIQLSFIVPLQNLVKLPQLNPLIYFKLLIQQSEIQLKLFQSQPSSPKLSQLQVTSQLLSSSKLNNTNLLF